ncbi:MAG: hypothetical protein K9G58_07265 [Bacteroidales bacterium]|nr:hypothetical protein [Bacteroidales bacterium]MCF8388139.1 hypothetical protein [Bacteroidales bacterium]MCF8397951.1 hypothetical protein [Bacteroidales bacterium]
MNKSLVFSIILLSFCINDVVFSQTSSPENTIRSTGLLKPDEKNLNDHDKNPIQIRSSVDTAGRLFVTLESLHKESPVYYTLNGNELSNDDPVFINAFEIKESENIRYGIFEMGELKAGPFRNRIELHMGIGKHAELRNSKKEILPVDASSVLLDGILGNHHYHNGQWLGFEGNDMILVIDLGSFHYVESVKVNFLNHPKAGIFMPAIVKFYYSAGGIGFTQLGEVKYQQHDPGEKAEIMEYQMDYPWIETRYIRVVAENIGKIPAGYQAKEENAWMFVDEVIVE